MRSRKFHPSHDTLEPRLPLSGAANPSTDYAVVSRWGRPEITYSIVPDGTIWNGLPSSLAAELDAKVGPGIWRDDLARVMQLWADSANISIVQVPDSGLPQGTPGSDQGDPRFGDIRIGGYGFGSADTAIAADTYYPVGGTTLAGDVMVNTDVNWYNIDFTSVLDHEIGHALGLGHAALTPEVMYPVYQGLVTALGPGDIAGIDAIYGVPVAPALNPFGIQNIEEGSTMQLPVSAVPGDVKPLAYSLTPGAPVGMTIDPTSGIITWTPPNVQWTYSFGVKATDTSGASATEQAQVNVFDQAPVVHAGLDLNAVARSTWYQRGTFTSPNPGPFTGAVDYGDGSASPLSVPVGAGFFMSHAYMTPGNYTVSVTVTDSQGFQGRGFFEVHVDAVPAKASGPAAPTPPLPSTPVPARKLTRKQEAMARAIAKNLHRLQVGEAHRLQVQAAHKREVQINASRLEAWMAAHIHGRHPKPFNNETVVHMGSRYGKTFGKTR